jgi:hypothetical protein
MYLTADECQTDPWQGGHAEFAKYGYVRMPSANEDDVFDDWLFHTLHANL